MSKCEPQLPQPVQRDSSAFDLKATGRWLILGDTHIPYHDPTTIELAVGQAKREGVEGVLLNGDVMDYHELSRWDKSPDDPKYRDEIKLGREFFRWLRYKLPKARIVYKLGNHEERLISYLCGKAPALFGLDILTTENLLELDEVGAECVGDRRVVRMGRLNIIHGHEYPHSTNPVNPARGLFLRAKAAALCNHFHAVSEHHEPTITGKPMGAWSVGCACGLSPLYLPLNKWCHGFAMVDVAKGGDFSVSNLKVINGQVVG